jgi:hypothetical protein
MIRTSYGMIERDFPPVTVDVLFEYLGNDYRAIGKFDESAGCFVSGTLFEYNDDGVMCEIKTATVWDEANRAAQVQLAEDYAKEAASW